MRYSNHKTKTNVSFCLLIHIYIYILTGVIGGIELPFDGCPVNACDHLSTAGSYPVATGDTIVYEVAIPVSSLKICT